MRLAAALVLCVIARGTSQSIPARDAQAPRPTASIAGRVTDAQSGAPLPRMVVTLVTADRAAQRETTTSADGR